jgi:pimeloyl-ACP methyl ester carboxylesterase
MKRAERPETRYARSGEFNIAYQVMGQGPLDLIVAPGWISNLDMHWEMPGYEEWVRRMTSFCRLIVFDKRGSGLSDRDVDDTTLEERMDDLRAVLDAAGSERAAVLGFSEGGTLGTLFAASYPERTRALVLFGTFPCMTRKEDFPEGDSLSGRVEELIHIIEEGEWGRGRTLDRISPSMARIPAAREFMGRFERASQSPRAALANLKWILQIDTRDAARSLHVPTLVIHRTDDQLVPVAGGRWLGAHVPGARFVELAGDEHAPWFGDVEAVAQEVEEFLTGSRGAAGAEVDRVLATVLFTDIVGSTERAVELGDRGWQDLLHRHHGLVRDEIRRHRGIERDTAGDGFFATFDGPARAVRCAQRICEGVRTLGLEVRAGVHTGECERSADAVRGIAVHIGARVMAEALPGEVLVSGTVRDLVSGSGLTFTDRGPRTLKGIPGEWRLYAAG